VGSTMTFFRWRKTEWVAILWTRSNSRSTNINSILEEQCGQYSTI
jgi:hypothetical protein